MGSIKASAYDRDSPKCVRRLGEILGNYVRLRPLDLGDAELVRGWRNDPRVARGYVDRRGITVEAQQQYVRSLPDDASQAVFVAEDLNRREPFGVCSLRQIDHVHRRAAIGILRNPDATEFGLQLFESGFLLFHFAFASLNLHKLTSEVFAVNHSARRWNEAMGLTIEGILRSHVWCDESFQDLVILGLLRDDFYQRPSRAVSMFLDSTRP